MPTTHKMLETEIDRLRAELADCTVNASLHLEEARAARRIAADLSAELAEAHQLRDAHHTGAINSRLETESLRAELAAKEIDLVDLNVIIHDLEDANAAKNAKIAELRQLCDEAADIVRPLREEIETLRKRVAELERHLENAGVYGNAGRYWEGRWRDEHAGNARLVARIAELEALGKRMSLAADSNGLGWMPLFDEARATFQGIAELNND
jgi:DNA repair exonuclease SbcCD ATPase subunit